MGRNDAATARLNKTIQWSIVSTETQMPDEDSNSLIPRPSGELSVGSGAERILSEMTSDALKIHQEGLIKTPEPVTVLWEFETGSWVLSSPAIGSDGTVYVGSMDPDNKLYAINGKSGVKLWEFETGLVVTSSPAIGSDGTVYVGSVDNKLYAIKTESLGLAKKPVAHAWAESSAHGKGIEEITKYENPELRRLSRNAS